MAPGAGLPSVVRSVVAVQPSYLQYRGDLRFDFWFSCAYCTISEAEACGIAFEIDHFSPQVGGTVTNVHAYDNLMWACGPCNGAKSNVWLSPAHQALGYRYLRPDEDCFDDHFEAKGVRLVPLTTPARFTHEVLNLDRGVLRTVREIRQRIFQNSAVLTTGLNALKGRKLDSLRPEARLRFEEARRTALDAVAKLSKELVEASDIRLLTKSPLPVYGPPDKEQTRRRRAFLKSVKALVPEIT